MALLLFILQGCTCRQKERAKPNWLYGRWLTVSVSASIIERAADKRGAPPEKHIIVFARDGEMRRYSPRRGWVRLLVKFRVQGDTVMMCPKTETEFLPLGKRLGDSTLELRVPPWGRYVYRRLEDGETAEGLDLASPPSIGREGE